MASTINADNGVVSGSSGVKTTADTSGVLALQSNGSTALSISTGLVTTLTNPLPVGSGGTGATSLSGITIGTATNLAGGSNGTIPYQSASGTTQMLAAGTSGQVLTSNGAAAPTWATPAPGAGTVTAVASGSLADGSMVILNSNGTVSVASSSAAAVTLTIAETASTSTVSYVQYMCVSASYDYTTNTVIVFYIRGSDGYLMGTAGIVTNSSISFGTTTVIHSANTKANSSYGFGSVYAPNASRHVVSYNLYDGLTYIKSVSTSGTSITVTSAAYYIFSNGATQGTRMVYDSASQKVVAAGADLSNLVMTAVVFGVGATTFDVGGQAFPFNTSGSSSTTGIGIDTVNNKIIVAGLNSSNYPTACVGTISGTSISFGSPTTIQSSAGNSYQYGFGVAYSPVYQKVGICFVTAASGLIQVVIGTVSGTSISFGTPVNSSASRSSGSQGFTGIYDTASTKMLFQTGAETTVVTSISGTTPTLDYYYVLPTVNGYGTQAVYAANLYTTLVCGSNGSTNYPTIGGFTSYSSTLTSTNFLGVSNAAYTNGQTATIQTVGSTDDAQSGLTPGLKYYVAPSGSLTSTATGQPYAGLALTSTKLVIKG